MLHHVCSFLSSSNQQFDLHLPCGSFAKFGHAGRSFLSLRDPAKQVGRATLREITNPHQPVKRRGSEFSQKSEKEFPRRVPQANLGKR